MNINDYINGVSTNITNNTGRDSITPFIIGKAFTDLATIVSTASLTGTSGSILDVSKFITGITSTNVINALGFVPISGFTNNINDTTFDVKYLPISSGQTIYNLQSGLTAANGIINNNSFTIGNLQSNVAANTLSIINLQTGLTFTNSLFANYQLKGNFVSAATLNNYYTSIQTDNKFLTTGFTVDLSNYQIKGNYVSASTLNNYYTAVQTDAKFKTSAYTPSYSEITGIVPDTSLSSNVPIKVSGKIQAFDLPSYVDDVLEFSTLSAFPASGETGKIYVTIDTNKTYRYTGSIYVEVSAGTTDAAQLVAGTLNDARLSSNVVFQSGLTATNARFNNYQPLGNYVSASTLNNYYTVTQSDSKYLTTGFTVDLSNYQIKGNYVSATTLNNYYTSAQSDNKFLPVSSGLTINNLQTGLTYTNSLFANYQTLGNYVSATTLNNYDLKSKTVRNITSPTTITDADSIINITGGTFTIYLPDSLNQTLNIKNSGSGTVTLIAVSIDGLSSVTLSNKDSLTLAYTGTVGTYIII